MRILRGEYLIDEHGTFCKIIDFSDLLNHLFNDNVLCFVDDLTDISIFPYLAEFVLHKPSKVLCDRFGKASSIRVGGGPKNSTRWIIQGKSWGVGEEGCEFTELSIEFLKEMWNLYLYVGVGMAPTPSSLGNLLMKSIYTQEGLHRQTCVSIAAENYLHQNSFGSIILSPGEGNHYDELAKIDMASAFLSKWVWLPIGAAVPFGFGHVSNFDTYFALCRIEIHSELALGPFPVRRENGQIRYPTLRGRYETYLWKEQVDDVTRAGASVEPISGIGWKDLSNDALQWSKYTYWLRKRAPRRFIEQCVKRVAVSAIGRHSTQRRHYYLVDESEASIEEVPVPDKHGNPLRFFVREEYDGRTAYMVHWNKYCIMECNREVYNFALPFAEQGRLVQMYVDSVLAVEENAEGQYIKRHSIESLNCEPGTWLLEWRHNVDVTSNGYTSDEENRLPGVAKR